MARNFLVTRKPDTLNVRPATVEDSSALARIQVDSYRSAYSGLLPQSYLDQFTYAEQAADWQDLISSADPANCLLLAETKPGEIVGYALGRSGTSELAPYDAELVALPVRPLNQRQGTGLRLVASMIARLKDKGCRSLIVWVLAENPARAFYERLGDP